MNGKDLGGYRYDDARPTHAHGFLLPEVLDVLAREGAGLTRRRLFELGCGNGAVASILAARGWDVTGVDPSVEGIAQAKRAYPDLKVFEGSAEEDLAGTYGEFPVVLSLDVVEHVFFPRRYAANLLRLVQPGGVAIVSTPYHGYAKNLALALTNAMDAHFTALWDYGHIKFWSMKTLGTLLREAGFRRVDFLRVGRIPPLAKSMIAIARRHSA